MTRAEHILELAFPANPKPQRIGASINPLRQQKRELKMAKKQYHADRKVQRLQTKLNKAQSVQKRLGG